MPRHSRWPDRSTHVAWERGRHAGDFQARLCRDQQVILVIFRRGSAATGM
jgi:hypothetical protein